VTKVREEIPRPEASGLGMTERGGHSTAPSGICPRRKSGVPSQRAAAAGAKARRAQDAQVKKNEGWPEVSPRKLQLIASRPRRSWRAPATTARPA